MATHRLAEMLELVALRQTDPAAAASRLRTLADQMHAELYTKADEWEAGAANPYASPGGFGDSVRMQVVNHEGKVVQEIDTKNGAQRNG